MGKMPAEAYLDKLLSSVDDQFRREKFKDTARTLEDAANFWEGEDAEQDFKELINKDKAEKEEKKSEQEDFLDSLLSGAKNTEFGMNKRKPDLNPMYSRRVSRSEADFLREFEAELESEADEFKDLFAEFEMVVEPEDRLEKNDIPVVTEDDGFTMGDVDLASLVDEVAGVMANVVEETISQEAILKEAEAEAPLSEEQPILLDEMSGDVFTDLFGGEEVIPLTDDVQASTQTPSEAIDLGNLGEEDLMSLLAGTEDLSDIGDMLSKGEVTEISEDELDAFAVFAENEMTGPQISAEPVPEQNDSEGETKKKKGDFLGKLKKFFVELLKDDEDDEIAIKASKSPTVDVLSGENAEILATLEALEEKPGKKGKAKKEKAKKEKKTKKPKAPKKPKAAKPPKPKKEKKPKEVDNTPPLPKGPVIMIWLMAASLVALVLLGVNLISYNTPMENAKILQNEGYYAEAFAEIKGLEIKEKDMEFYNQLVILSTVDSELNAYEVFLEAEMQDKAFDSLICAAGRCYLNEADADVFGCLGQLEILKRTASNELEQRYQMTYEEAIEMYTIRDRDDYTLALYKKLTELGIDWE